MSKAIFRTYASLTLVLGMLVTVAVLISCGGGPSMAPAPQTSGPVTTTITDPPTCAAPSGGFSNVWVTITRVRAHISSTAGPDDSGWVDLVDLRSSPKQIDLLSLASTTCLLTQLGSTSGLPPGNYQQIRLHLLSNTPASGEATPATNNCGSGAGAPFNCVVPSGGQPQTLQLSSEAQTGIKIPPGQIAGGGIMLTTGQSADLNIDFDACASVLQQGNGQFRLKPTLRAGEVALNNNSISGTVVDGVSGKPISGAIVLLEQPDSSDSTTDRVVGAKRSASDGTFIFCPLPPGTYDVVAAATTTSAMLVATTYNATIAFHVPLGTALTTIPLTPEPGGTLGTSSQAATITGQVTSSTSVADVTLSALQDATPSGSTSAMHVTIPLFESSSAGMELSVPTPTVVTAPPPAGSTCDGGAPNCVDYSLMVPASNPSVGTFSSGSITYSPPAAPPVTYSINGVTATPPPAGCTNSPQTASSVTVTAGSSTAATTLAFTGCTSM